MQDQLLGYQLGNYRLIQVLGQGSFAQVYRGQHVHLGVFTAVKVLHAQFGEQEKQNFHKEAVLLTTLKHPHIIRFLDYGFISGRPYLITDLAEKGSLNKMHPRGTRLPMSQINNYVAQIAEGLDFAHGQHIVHRDIKPENILVGDNGELLLADFGIAKLVSNTGSYMTASMSGTLPYMAPELFDGRPSPTSDQYALGIMVYEWLAGRFPFEGTAGELIRHHLLDQPPPLRAFNPAVSLEIGEVVMMALKKDPALRFRTMQAFANALRQASGSRVGAQSSQPMPSDPGVVPVHQNTPPQPIQSYPPQPVPGDPRVAANVQMPPAVPRVANPVTGPQASPSMPVGPTPARTPVSSDPAHGAGQQVNNGPMQTIPTADPIAWQALMPPPRALAFTELPGLPQARLTDYWWPTFLVAPEQRRKINEGTITSETLSALGPLASFPSISVPLPVSNSAKPLSIGRLDAVQRISTGTRIPALAPIRPAAGAAPVHGTGRVAAALSQQPVQVQVGVPQPTARIAQPVKAGKGAASSSSSASTGSSGGAAGALTFTVLTFFVSIICTISGESQHAQGALGASWTFLVISFIICIFGLARSQQRSALRSWLTFFLIALIFMVFVNFGAGSDISRYCSNYSC
ncbi:MAG TPA: protein kinase [Ktedonobacteraceae bacterium]